MIGCIVIAFALCNAGYSGSYAYAQSGSYAQSGYYVQQAPVYYAPPPQLVYVPVQPMPMPYYGGGGYPSVNLNIGGNSYGGRRYYGGRRCC